MISSRFILVPELGNLMNNHTAYTSDRSLLGQVMATSLPRYTLTVVVANAR